MVIWNTGLVATRARFNLKLNKKRRPAVQATSSKLQAPSKKVLDSHKIPDIKYL